MPVRVFNGNRLASLGLLHCIIPPPVPVNISAALSGPGTEATPGADPCGCQNVLLPLHWQCLLRCPPVGIHGSSRQCPGKNNRASAGHLLLAWLWKRDTHTQLMRRQAQLLARQDVDRGRNSGFFGMARLPEGWRLAQEPGDLHSIARYATVAGKLQLRVVAAPGEVTMDRLRLLTNVSQEIGLPLRSWDSYSGYEHTYPSGDSYVRQWWIAGVDRIFLFVYRTNLAERDSETALVNELVRQVLDASP